MLHTCCHHHRLSSADINVFALTNITDNGATNTQPLCPVTWCPSRSKHMRGQCPIHFAAAPAPCIIGKRLLAFGCKKLTRDVTRNIVRTRHAMQSFERQEPTYTPRTFISQLALTERFEHATVLLEAWSVTLHVAHTNRSLARRLACQCAHCKPRWCIASGMFDRTQYVMRRSAKRLHSLSHHALREISRAVGVLRAGHASTLIIVGDTCTPFMR